MLWRSPLGANVASAVLALQPSDLGKARNWSPEWQPATTGLAIVTRMETLKLDFKEVAGTSRMPHPLVTGGPGVGELVGVRLYR